MKRDLPLPTSESLETRSPWSIREGSVTEMLAISPEVLRQRFIPLLEVLSINIESHLPTEAKKRLLNAGIMSFAVEAVAPDRASHEELEYSIQSATAYSIKLRDEQRAKMRTKAVEQMPPVLEFIDYLFEQDLIDRQTQAYAQEVAGILLEEEEKLQKDSENLPQATSNE